MHQGQRRQKKGKDARLFLRYCSDLITRGVCDICGAALEITYSEALLVDSSRICMPGTFRTGRFYIQALMPRRSWGQFFVLCACSKQFHTQPLLVPSVRMTFLLVSVSLLCSVPCTLSSGCPRFRTLSSYGRGSSDTCNHDNIRGNDTKRM